MGLRRGGGQGWGRSGVQGHLALSDLDVAWVGLIAEEQPAVCRVLRSAGLAPREGMQSYLCMMAVRPWEMRRALKDGGPAVGNAAGAEGWRSGCWNCGGR